MARYVLAIDQGTTGTTCLVLDVSPTGLNVVGRGYAEVPQHFPQPGWVEHDLSEIWSSVEHAISLALKAGGVRANELLAIGITNQRETTGLWNRRGEPLQRAIVWQDRRTAARCQALKDADHQDLVRRRTGLVLDPYFSATKLAWLLSEGGLRGRVERDGLLFGTIDTWLVYKLTGGAAHVTDASNAARTLLFDIHRGAWDPELCALFGDLPMSLLPQVCGSSEVYGQTRGLAVLPDGIPVAGMAGDQQAALFGQACFTSGMAKCTYGTGAFVLVNTGQQAVASSRGLLTTIAWRLADVTTYALEGSTFVAGALVQWLRDGLGIITQASDIEPLARSVPDSGGLVVVPALTGLGAPHWRPEARGLIAGITRGTTRAHLARAALEGIALQIADLLGAMADESGQPLTSLRVDGGAAANNLLLELQAGLAGVAIDRPQGLESTAFGAACLGALGAGLFTDMAEISRAWRLDRHFEPALPSNQVREILERWRIAVQQA